MPNPNRKPVENLIDRDPRRKAPSLAVLPGRELEVAPEAGWLKATKDGWVAFWSADLAGAIDGADVPVIRRLFGMRDVQARAFARWKKKPYVDGSQGQPVKNPAFDEAMVLERAIVQLEDRLGLSPKARANLGIAIGQARMTAAELNRQAQESMTNDDHDVIEAEGWEAV